MRLCNNIQKTVGLLLACIVFCLLFGCSTEEKSYLFQTANQVFGMNIAHDNDCYLWVDYDKECEKYVVFLNEEPVATSDKKITGVSVKNGRFAYSDGSTITYGEKRDDGYLLMNSTELVKDGNLLVQILDDESIVAYAAGEFRDKVIYDEVRFSTLYYLKSENDGLVLEKRVSVPAGIGEMKETLFEFCDGITNYYESIEGLQKRFYDSYCMVNDVYFGRGSHINSHKTEGNAYSFVLNGNEYYIDDYCIVEKNTEKTVIEKEIELRFLHAIHDEANSYLYAEDDESALIYRFDGSALDEVIRLNNDEKYLGGSDNQIYILDTGKDCLNKTNLATGEKQIVFDLKDLNGCTFEYCGKYLYIQHNDKTSERISIA